MNILKIITLLIGVTFSSHALAQTLLFEMTYPADEQASGCEVHHALYLNDSEQVSMQWFAESVCSGDVVTSEQVTFSQNTMKAWPILLRKAAAWADKDTLEKEVTMHHWGKHISVKALRDINILGEKHVYFTIQNKSFPLDLQRPMLIDVSNKGWKKLAGAIAQYVSLHP